MLSFARDSSWAGDSMWIGGDIIVGDGVFMMCVWFLMGMVIWILS